MRPSQEKHHSEVFQKPGVESLSRPKAINEQMPTTDQVMRVRMRAPATWKSLPSLMQFQETGWTKPEWEQEAARGVEAVETELLEEPGCEENDREDDREIWEHSHHVIFDGRTMQKREN